MNLDIEVCIHVCVRDVYMRINMCVLIYVYHTVIICEAYACFVDLLMIKVICLFTHMFTRKFACMFTLILAKLTVSLRKEKAMQAYL